MSTKQAVIFTFMVLFLGLMLYCMGSYFYWSIEHDVKEKSLKVLAEKKTGLDLDLTNKRKDEKGNPVGLKEQLDDPEVGLKHYVEFSKKDADGARLGAEAKQSRHAEWEPKLEAKVPKVKTDWAKVYTDWRALDDRIKSVRSTYVKQIRDKDDRIATGEAERNTELDNESIERANTIKVRKDNENAITAVRLQQQEIKEKTDGVSRELTKKVEIHPQGLISFSAADDLKFVVIDKGSKHGVKRGLRFAVFANFPGGIVQKGLIEITEVNTSSSNAVLVSAKSQILVDAVTGYETTDLEKRFSPFSAGGDEGLLAVPLEKPKTKEDRLELYRQEKLKASQDLQGSGAAVADTGSAPPVSLGVGFSSIVAGDWIFSKDFAQLLPDDQFQEKTRRELISMKDVNTGPLVFYFAATLKPFRQEYLKRVCERNGCRIVDSMTHDVNFVITSAGNNTISTLKEKLDPKNKLKTKEDIEKAANSQEEATADIKSTRSTLAALLEAQKLGADVLLDDDLDAFFSRRQRKMELLRGKVIQPGQSTFYIAGEMKNRSTENLGKWITDHKGVVLTSLDAKVDYVVVGTGLDQAFYDKLKTLGLKIIRESELPHFFGVENQP